MEVVGFGFFFTGNIFLLRGIELHSGMDVQKYSSFFRRNDTQCYLTYRVVLLPYKNPLFTFGLEGLLALLVAVLKPLLSASLRVPSATNLPLESVVT